MRPVLNLRLDKDVKAMRAIAEEAFAMVRAYKGSHSGEHGDGLVRSEFHEFMFGPRLVPGLRGGEGHVRSARACSIPARSCARQNSMTAQIFRYAPGYRGAEMQHAARLVGLSGRGRRFPGRGRDVQQQRRLPQIEGGVMCPSYRVTRDERDVTRGRANSLRLAITGQLGPDALTSDEMAETLKLCVSCKACRRECPTGVDMARMKIEVQAARAAKHGLSLHDRLVG